MGRVISDKCAEEISLAAGSTLFCTITFLCEKQDIDL